MTIIICDRCKKEHDDIYMFGFGRVAESLNKSMRFDLCPDCANKIQELIRKEIDE
jgi:hypothetical protein